MTYCDNAAEQRQRHFRWVWRVWRVWRRWGSWGRGRCGWRSCRNRTPRADDSQTCRNHCADGPHGLRDSEGDPRISGLPAVCPGFAQLSWWPLFQEWKEHKDLNLLEPLLAWEEMKEDHNAHRFLQWSGSCSPRHVLCCCNDGAVLFQPSPRFEPWQHGRNPIRILMLVPLVWFLRHLFGHYLLAAAEPCFPRPHLHQPNGPWIENSRDYQLGWNAETIRFDAHSVGSNVDWEVVVPIWAGSLLAKQERSEKGTHHQANLFRASSHCFLLDHGCCHNSFHNGTGRSRSWSKSIFCSCYHDRFLERGGCLCGHEHLAKLFPRFGHHATSVAVHLFRRYSEFLLRKQPSWPVRKSCDLWPEDCETLCGSVVRQPRGIWEDCAFGGAGNLDPSPWEQSFQYQINSCTGYAADAGVHGPCCQRMATAFVGHLEEGRSSLLAIWFDHLAHIHPDNEGFPSLHWQADPGKAKESVPWSLEKFACLLHSVPPICRRHGMLREYTRYNLFHHYGALCHLLLVLFHGIPWASRRVWEDETSQCQDGRPKMAENQLGWFVLRFFKRSGFNILPHGVASTFCHMEFSAASAKKCWYPVPSSILLIIFVDKASALHDQSAFQVAHPKCRIDLDTGGHTGHAWTLPHARIWRARDCCGGSLCGAIWPFSLGGTVPCHEGTSELRHVTQCYTKDPWLPLRWHVCQSAKYLWKVPIPSACFSSEIFAIRVLNLDSKSIKIQCIWKRPQIASDSLSILSYLISWPSPTCHPCHPCPPYHRCQPGLVPHREATLGGALAFNAFAEMNLTAHRRDLTDLTCTGARQEKAFHRANVDFARGCFDVFYDVSPCSLCWYVDYDALLTLHVLHVFMRRCIWTSLKTPRIRWSSASWHSAWSTSWRCDRA